MINNTKSSLLFIRNHHQRCYVTFVLRGNARMHSAQMSCCLQGLRDGDCLKLTQDDHYILLTYRLSEKMEEKCAEVGLQLMRLNGLVDGQCLVQPLQCGRMQHLKVRISHLGWKIVNANQLKIAGSFLEQVAVVWPDAAIPIFYDEVNFVTLYPQVERAGRLDINTTVEFVEEQKAEEGKGDESQLQAKQEVKVSIKLGRQSEVQQGYLNAIKVSRNIFEDLGEISEPLLWIVQNNTQFTECPRIQELIQLQKNRQTIKDKSQQISYKKLVILSIDESQQLQKEQFQCSLLCKKVIGLSDSIYISNQPQYEPNVQTLGLQIFMKDTNYVIKIEEIIRSEQFYDEKRYMQRQQSVIKLFANHIANVFISNSSYLILQNAYPYYLQNALFLISLQNKKKNVPLINFYQIKQMGSFTQQKATQFRTQLMQGKIIFYTQRNPQINASLQRRYQDIGKWKQIYNTYLQGYKKRNDQVHSTQAVCTLFSTIYPQQIRKVEEFIQSNNQSKQICLVTSFGSNGKSLLHSWLSSRGKKMWKVSFRELTDPHLTYHNIELYLHWVFANSPYTTVYLDDIDAICSKIQESDQHKKKDKIVSKLIIRTVMRYIKMYSRRVVATAKSQSALDDQLPPRMVVNFKNPTLELRQRALRALHIVARPDDSPIRKIKPDISGTLPVHQSTIVAVAQSTQSLNFGSFCKHAVELSQPQTKTVSQCFDFSKLAGLTAAKNTVKNIIQKPIKYAFLFRSVPIKLPRGILLYGGTGNGKTALGSALKDEFKMRYFSVKGSDILSKYIGGSEAAVRDVFEKALSVSPSIIFFDEFESIVPKRSANNTGVNDRIVNQFLCYLDGVSSISGVYIVAASSRPDLIDPAVLRPGRLDAHLFLDYPTSEERRELIILFGNSVKIAVEEDQLVKATQKFSFSDMIGLFKQLRIKRAAQVLKTDNYRVEDFTCIDQQLFRYTLAGFKLSVAPGQQYRQKKIFQAFMNGVAPDIREQRQMQQ